MNQDSSPTTDEFVDSDVFALDNIRLDLAYAGLGSRVLAGMIDYALFYGLSIVLAIATASLLALIGGGLIESLGGWVVAIAVLLFFLFESFWFAAQEIWMGGQTLGKRALSLRTVSAQGHAASRTALLLRNLVKMLDILVGAWFLALDKRSRRLGDRLAGTAVVHESEQESHAVLRRVPRGWGPEKIALAEELLDRLYGLDESVARSLSESMLALVEQDDAEFLADVPGDLNPMTQLALAFGEAGSGGVE